VLPPEYVESTVPLRSHCLFFHGQYVETSLSLKTMQRFHSEMHEEPYVSDPNTRRHEHPSLASRPVTQRAWW